MSKVKYKKNGNVSIEISMDNYNKLLKSYNDLRNIIGTIAECNDLWLSDVRKLEDLRFRLNVLGFVIGKDWYSDATLPKGEK